VFLFSAYHHRFHRQFGVFVSTNSGASWTDRTAPGMRYYTKDLVIDPAVASQNRWYVGVWGEWGSSAGCGGLYVTTNRGLAWTRLMAGYSVGSCTPLATDTNEMYVTTENDGLWVTTNRMAAAPIFTQVAGYPFRFPTRVFPNPWNSNEVWVTSSATVCAWAPRRSSAGVHVHYAGNDGHGRAPGRERPAHRVRTSTNLVTWQTAASVLVPDNVLTTRVPFAGATLFLSATVE